MLIEPNRGFLIGNIWGLCMRAESDEGTEVFGKVEIMTDEEGNYLPFIYITRASGKYKISIELADENEEGFLEI